MLSLLFDPLGRGNVYLEVENPQFHSGSVDF